MTFYFINILLVTVQKRKKGGPDGVEKRIG